MKRTFAFVAVLLLAFSIFVIPSLAFSPTFDPVYVNNDERYLCFDEFHFEDNPTIDLTAGQIQSSCSWEYDPDEGIERYGVYLFFFFLYSDKTIPDSFYSFSYNIRRVDNNAVYSSGTISSDSFFIDYELLTTRLAATELYYEFDLSALNAVYDLSYLSLCVLPVAPLSIQQSVIDSYKSAYYSLNQSNIAYENGYNQGVLDSSSLSYQQGYSQGEIVGYGNGYSIGLGEGFANGESYGYPRGYNAGFAAGEQSDITRDIKSTFLYVVSAPFLAISNFLDFNVLGLNLRQIFAFVFSSALFAWVLKHIL